MGRDKKKKGAVATAATGTHAKTRHKRDRKGNIIDWTAPMPPGLVAIPDKPQLSKKYKTWYEAVENKNKKKRLEFEFTQSRQPPPGMEFVPIGNPALTTLCKELSRERDAMIFIVTSSNGMFSAALSLHLNRVGHHFRESIVEEARKTLGDDQLVGASAQLGLPEPIPERQEDINKQADAAIRDLFPRIPHTDRQMILDHAFNKVGPSSSSLRQHNLTLRQAKLLQNKDSAPVGLAADITLSRRVQLAVLAHIRHNHTRYDQLLKETSWVNARKAVESLCLDYLVKWRGDEETGRDQLDEILYEVIVISDSESDDEDDEDDDEDDSSDTSVADEDDQAEVNWRHSPNRASQLRPHHLATHPAVRPATEQPRGDSAPRVARAERSAIKKNQQKDRKAAKWAQRGFSRYQAARDVAWSQAVERQRLEPQESRPSAALMANGRSASHGPLRIEHPVRLESDLTTAHSPKEPVYYTRTPFNQQNGFQETGSRPGYMDITQRTSATTSSHVPEAVRAHRSAAESGFGPIVGSRPYPYREVERARHYHGHEPKDHVLQSIEPASPTRFPVQQSSSAARSAPMRYMTYGADVPTSRPAEPQEYRTLGGDEGFVRLPPRTEQSRMPNGPGGSSLHRLTTYQDNVPRHGAAPLRSEARPIYVEDDGLVRRSEARPIYIEDTPAPAHQSWAESMHPQLTTRPFAIRGAADVRPTGPIDVARHDGRYADERIQPMDRLRGDFIEIVRVSNNFPRRHELSPIPVDTGEFDGHSVPVNTQARRIERVVAYERPGYPPEHVGRVPVYQQADFIRLPQRSERQERVVGIEYRPVHPGYDHGPGYEVGRPYQSRTATVPMSHPGVENQQPRFVRQVPRNDEVIAID
ncbi:hypothetical protein B0T21DRAFT_379595 [Apiosordaria backusii]|uniref:DUF2293 domain-containing protein n=1 Tax=Apiosordaria backusii TaxID=314023 RepID=A0AA40EXX1_9PEZI|nr:hypothetical protein B0T21DRAFT_379595 [Apiosordaria backusii]